MHGLLRICMQFTWSIAVNLKHAHKKKEVLLLGATRGTHWTWHQSIAGQQLTHAHTFKQLGNLEQLINLILMSLDCGKKPGYPEETQVSLGCVCVCEIGEGVKLIQLVWVLQLLLMIIILAMPPTSNFNIPNYIGNFIFIYSFFFIFPDKGKARKIYIC